MRAHRLALALALVAVWPARARAEYPVEAPAPVEPAPADEPAHEEIGARLGFQSGLGGLTPGGLVLGGVFLYRMSTSTWFDGGASFVFGGGAAACYTDRQGDFTCDHGIVDGFGMNFDLGVRVPLARRKGGLLPYVRGGISLAYARFGDDDVTGVGLPLWASVGGRFRVANRVTVGGEALLRLGFGLYNHDQGLEALAALGVQFGVEFEL
jgi:hypothetical protein